MDTRPDLPLAGHMTSVEFAERVSELATLDADGGPSTSDRWRYLLARVTEWRDVGGSEVHADCVTEEDHAALERKCDYRKTEIANLKADLKSAEQEISRLSHIIEDAGPVPPPSVILQAARTAIAGIRDVLPALSAATCGGPARKRHAVAISRHLGYLEAATRPTPAASEEAQQ